MKLDSRDIVSPGALGHNADSKPVEFANTAFDSTKLKFLQENDKENQNGLQSDFEERKVDSDQLEYQVDNVGGRTESRHEHDDRETAVREYIEDSVFYLDKSVMEHELPEVVVYKENTYQVVKDICIDTGEDPKSLCIILPPEKETTGQMIRGNEDPDAPIPDEFKFSVEQTDLHHCPPDEPESSQENDSQSDSCISSNYKASRLTGDGRDDINEMGANVLSKDDRSLRDLLSMTHWGTELSWPKSNIDDVEESKRQFFQKAREDLLPEMDSAHSKPQNGNEEVTLGELRLVSAAEGLDHGVGGVGLKVPSVECGVSEPDHTAEELAAEGLDHGIGGVGLKVPSVDCGVSEPDHTAEELEIVHQEMDTETAVLASELNELDDPNELTSSSAGELTCKSQIETVLAALDLNSTAPVSNCEESYPQKTDEHLEPQNACGLQLDGPNTSSSHPRHSQGETSFSDAVPFSCLVTYTGPIAYSGSLSLRSDSSTTSTRSFAFPVLQSEWNNSPVRMAKADRKHLGRHRRWRHGLFCCKF